MLEPCKVGIMMELSGGSGDIQLKLSDLRMNLSPDVLELAMSLQSSVLEPLVQPAPDKCAYLSLKTFSLLTERCTMGCLVVVENIRLEGC